MIKPFGDLMVAGLALVITMPLWVSVALLLAISNRGQIFFTQLRPGKNGIPFRLIKFKTMNDQRDAHGELLPDAQRLTPVGKFIRKTSLDELPQLINVLKGEMSLVGPRPLLMEYLPLYSTEQARRHRVRPGITGWAQVNGRNALSWSEKFNFDVWYVDHQSIFLDLKILLLTVVRVLRAQGISGGGSVTMTKFDGNN